MKTERRHELHTNALANWLGDQIDRVKPYSTAALGTLLALVVLVGVYYYLSGQSQRERQEGWQRYFAALEDANTNDNSEQLLELAQSSDFQGTAVGYWSQISLADYNLSRGVNLLFTDRAAATKSLRTALDNYTRVADQSEYPLLAERGAIGMARAYESLNDLEKARAAYESVMSKWPGGIYDGEARRRLNDLGRDATKKFYDWFAEQKPRSLPLGGPGIPGLRPDFGSLPDEGSFRPPKTDSGASDPARRLNLDASAPSSEQPAGDAAAEKPADAPPEGAPSP